MALELAFEAELWQHDSPGGWHFVTVSREVGDEVRERADRRGFGSVRVTAAVGGSSWRTSVFPDAASGSFLLPVKQPVRRAEGLGAGDVVRVVLHVELSHPGPPRGD